MAKKKKRDTVEEGKYSGIVKAPLRLVSKLLRGQIISSDFFGRHWLMMLICVMLIMVYITNKYNCQTAMEEIKELDRELEVARTEAIRVRSHYMTKITEQAMQERLDSLHLDLSVREHPPFRMNEEK